jgi:hypothetical protein
VLAEYLIEWLMDFVFSEAEQARLNSMSARRRSPNRTRQVASALLAARVTSPEPRVADAARWIADNYDPAWLVSRAMHVGIGIHHGKVPRSLAQFMVRAFNSGLLRFLLCTSTLIEGVNTAAKNVVIFDNQLSRRRFDYFTFANIRGRSGRMFRHFVGRVYLFHDAPTARLPVVDVPVLSQPAKAPSSLLVQLETEDLTPASRARLAPILSQVALTVQTIRENKGVPPERQIEVARELRSRARQLHPLLAWQGNPRWEQLRETSHYVWRLSGFSSRTAGIVSGPQLAFKLSRLASNPMARDYIQALAQDDGPEVDADERVENALEFTRQWAGHHAPKLFASLDRIQQEVFVSLGFPQVTTAYTPDDCRVSFFLGRLRALTSTGFR